MSWICIWSVCGFALLAVLAEIFGARRSKRIRDQFHQPIFSREQERRTFLLVVIVTVISLLTASFCVVSSSVHTSPPKDGIAIVIDPNSIASDKSLWFGKNVAESIIDRCQDLPISIYELRGGCVFSVCPPTIDSVFLKLQLGSIAPAPVLGNSSIALDTIEAMVVSKYRALAPWVVVVSTNSIVLGEKRPNGAAYVVVGGNEVDCFLCDGRSCSNLNSIDLLVKEIRYKLSESQKSNAIDSESMLMLSIIVAVAFCLFLYWRANKPSLYFFLFVLVVPSFGLFPDEIQANSIVQDAVDLSQAGSILDGEQKIAMLLNCTSSTVARNRLIYDSALLAYLRGDDVAALNWVNSVMQDQVDKSLKRDFLTLQGIVLIRLLSDFSTNEEYLKRKTLLKNFLNAKPLVNSDLLDAAEVALKTAGVKVDTSIRFTIHWLQNALIASQGENGEPLFRCAEDVTTVTNGMVQDYLVQFFDQKTVSLFLHDASSIKNMIDLNRVYLWYYLAEANTVGESIDYLFQEGCTLSNRALYFSFFRPIAEANLPMIEGLLLSIKERLPQVQKREFELFFSQKSMSLDVQASHWYVHRVLWKAVLEEGKARYKAIAVALVNESRIATSRDIQKLLADTALQIVQLSPLPTDCSDPLGKALETVLREWYKVDKLDAFALLMANQGSKTGSWNMWLIRLLEYSMEQDANFSPLCRQISNSVLRDGVDTFDPGLLGYLWKLGLTVGDTNQLFSLRLHEINDLLSALNASLADPSDQVLKTFCLMYQEMPLIMQMLQNGGVYFRGEKRETYTKLLYDFSFSTTDIQASIVNPETFRLPRVRDKVSTCSGIILQMMQLSSEMAERQGGGGGGMMTQGEYGSTRLQGEGAVALFQELDRSDRALGAVRE